MTMITLAAIAASSAILILLCLGDPKRRRAARLEGTEMAVGKRRALTALACLPGFSLAVSGAAAAFFIWLGACGVAGWLIALWFRQPRRDIV